MSSLYLRRVVARTIIGLFLVSSAAPLATAEDVLRAGIVGCDTSHVGVFTKLINDPQAIGPLAQVEIACAFPGGSADIPTSRDRVEGFTKALRDANVEIVDTIADVVEHSDAILLESLDGRVHLDQFRQLAVGKPVFIDKPAAASLVDVMEIFRIAKATNTPCYTSSALRFSDNVVALKQAGNIGKIVGCSVASPFQTEPHHPDLFWYGVHGVESIYALLGTGCERVSRTNAGQATVVVGAWSDGRFATYQGLKGHADYAFMAFGAEGVAGKYGFSGYGPAATEICKFFVTRQPPVLPEETLEMFAFMEAADESLRRDGRPVPIQEMVDRARQKVAATPAQ